MKVLHCSTLLLLVVLFARNACAVRQKKFYDILGVPEDADDRVIKRAYKNVALHFGHGSARYA